jgi:hypothetical protein
MRIIAQFAELIAAPGFGADRPCHRRFDKIAISWEMVQDYMLSGFCFAPSFEMFCSTMQLAGTLAILKHFWHQHVTFP